MIKIVFSDHAKEVNLKRKIQKKQITETIRKPDEIKESFRGREIRRRKYKGKILEVVIIKEEKTITVITQYYLGEKNGS
ncbi:MAG: hypothetical protein UT63_C0006G0018 [Candidatus Gottesmanbacteria bacterium GW2011_GWC2_39_8]|uniref:DUF4258 domain-containing protein n=1 Tax=Candidatus Gottesmanbacteria bacterium GW2011_GWC2_39_8 TaxID=1618450 RepID=A0A0G0SHC1_9BACT|nr:MAG: hypothetical protein UT63_C0006G0018 [Candidatus Gottesmanbacteria bacterium GW2011_GWC2_39_8]